MTLKEFLQNAAAPDLVGVIRSAIARPEIAGTYTYSAHFADALLDGPSVGARIADDLRVRAKAGLAPQLASFSPSDPGANERFAFGISAPVDPAVALARERGADRVAPFTVLTPGLTCGLLKGPESVCAQEALRRPALTVEGLIPNDDSVQCRAILT
jgi:hypothetical protein